MGYREDVALAVTSDGWTKVLASISALTPEDYSSVNQLLSDADEHWEHPDGHQLFVWSCIKTYSDDFQLFTKILKSHIDYPSWFMSCLGEDGAEEFVGEWYDNPFGTCIVRQLSYSTDDCLLNAPLKKAAPNAMIGLPKVAVVDNHTCVQCQNPKCSKTEKSCWKCGHPIAP